MSLLHPEPLRSVIEQRTESYQELKLLRNRNDEYRQLLAEWLELWLSQDANYCGVVAPLLQRTREALK